jgi:hypothetical protein
MTLNIEGLYETLSISDSRDNDTQHQGPYNKGLMCDTQHKWHSANKMLSITMLCHNAEFRVLFIAMLNVIVLSMSAVMLKIVMLSVIRLSVVAPFPEQT